MKNIRKISALTAILLSAAIILSACGAKGSAAPMGFKEISSDNVDYDLFVPDEWTSDISTGITAAYFNNTDPSNISMMAFLRPNDPIADETAKDYLDAYWKTYEPSLTAIFEDFEYVGTPDDVTVDGVPARQYTYTGKMAGKDYKIMQIIAERNAQIYIFTYTAESDKYDAHWEDVKSVLDNIVFH